MHERIPLITCLLIMATESVLIQNCPSGSLEAVESTADLSLICVEYSGTIVWAYRLGKEITPRTIGTCGSTCTMNTGWSSFFSLTRLSDSSSRLAITSSATTLSYSQVIYTCETASCTVNIVEPIIPPPGVRIQNCPSGSLEAVESTADFSLTCVEYNGTADWTYKLPRNSAATAIGACGSACTVENGSSSYFSLTRLSDSSSRLGITTSATTSSFSEVIYTCETARCTVSIVVSTTRSVPTTRSADTANTSMNTQNSGNDPGSNTLLIIVGSLGAILPVVDAFALVAFCKRRGRTVITSAPIQDTTGEAPPARTTGRLSEAEGTDTGPGSESTAA